ncbi:Zn-ribbon domain-containing OB-fold protein [Nocardia africana]|uniref:Zn-ribbon domain-containing OB-fold protein n=1 Tax=Nocardia africana TaxID=134964 RepID=A0ABW6NTP4_9NOCA
MSCRSTTLEWVPSSGEGAIVSWRVVYRAPLDRRVDEWTPSLIAIVALDEGPWVYTSVEGEIPPTSDQPVRVKFEPRPASGRFPVFATRSTAGQLLDNSLVGGAAPQPRGLPQGRS